MVTFQDSYTDKNGKEYNIRNINLSDKSDLMNVGKYITETKREVSGFWTESDNLENGVYIFQSNYDPKKALRIYKDYALYKYAYHDDEKYISKLQDIQKKVKYTQFPTGIVTIDNYVIGQEIPFYASYENLYEKIQKLKDVRKIYDYYFKIIRILEELADNNIIYKDLHPKNFMVFGNTIKLIDFEKDSFEFSNNTDLLLKKLREFINFTNNCLNLNFEVKSNTLDRITGEIISADRINRLIKK